MSTSAAHPARTVAALIAGLVAMPGQPRLTWYSHDGERIELSGAVLENWVNKTSNLLLEEFDAEPGTRIALDLPAHWRTVVWALATWRVGATLVPGSSTADIVVTDHPPTGPRGRAAVILVALPALARSAPDLPPGAIDAAAAVMTYADALGPVHPYADQALAVDPGGITYAGLAQWALGLPDPLTTAERVLIPLDSGRPGALDLIRLAYAILALDGSVVVADGLTPPELERLRATERVTSVRRLRPPG